MSVASSVHVAVITALIGLPLAVLVLVRGRQIKSFYVSRRSQFANRVKPAKRRCRYCLMGRARLTEQTVRIEADDLVTVRCWACSSCGLPHWTVTRSPVLKPVRSKE
jgi:uncharacterized protein with PIN domain